MKWVGMALAVLVVRPAAAYDSSGGKRVAEIINTMDFQDSQHQEFDPPYFPWTAQTRAQAKAFIQAVLEQMPLDIVQTTQLRLRLSNSPCATPLPDTIFDDPEFKDTDARQRSELYLDACNENNAFYSEPTKTFYMSGNYLRLAGTLQNDRMIASVLLHELTHSWQHAREADNPGMLAQFFKMRFDKREKSWKAVGKAHDDFLKRRTGEMGRAEGSAFKRCLRSQDGAAGAQSLCQARNSALEDGNEREYAELQDEASLSADALYELMSLPSRFGGSTGHDYPFLEPGRTPLDRHAMEDGDEYLAILSQTIWVAPDLASRYYSLREIDWVKREVFGSRPIMPFQPPEGGTLAIQSHLGGGRMTERLDSVTAPAAAFLNNDASRQP